MQDLSGKVVWITGASSGIGKEAATQLYKIGAKLILSARTESALLDLKKSLGNGDDILIIPLDLTRQEAFPEAVEKAYNKMGRVDLVLNNAGISQRSYIVETDLSVDRKIMEVNYFGTIALTKAILPRMIEQGGGHFAVVSSVVGKFGFGVRSAYSASKHALHGFFESLYIELKHKGIGITIVCPGPIQTNISKNALDGSGNPSGKMDEMQQKGMPVEKCVRIILNAIQKEKREIIVAGFKEKLGVKLKAWLPSLFFKIALKQDPRGEVKF